MQKLALALTLLLLDCDWPPWPGTFLGAGISGLCGTDWTPIITDAHGVAPLKSVYVTDSAIYAVGEKGQIVVVKHGEAPFKCALSNADSLTSISIFDTNVLMSGLAGIYETSTTNLCSQSTITLSPIYTMPNCYDTAISEGTALVACNQNIIYKTGSIKDWTKYSVSSVSYRGAIFTNTEAFVGADNRSIYRASLSDLGKWAQVTDSGLLLIVKNIWYDENDTLYLVGNAGLFSMYQIAGNKWVHRRSELSADLQSADIVSIWGQSSLKKRFFSAKGKSNFFCVDENGTIGCDSRSTLDFFGIHGNQQIVFRVGSHGSTTGFMDCKQL